MVFAEKAGEFNIGMEGIMLTAATSTYLVQLTTNSLLLGILIGPVVGFLFGIFLSISQIRLKADQTVLGLAIILFGIGIDPYLANLAPSMLVGAGVDRIPRLQVPSLSNVPLLSILSNQNIVVYLSFLAIPIVWLVLNRTFYGMKAVATGESPRGSDLVGVKVYKIKYINLIVSCIIGGIAGGYFIYGLLGGWIIGITGGTGFLAIAITRISNWNAILTGLYSILVSFLFSLQFLGQIALGGVPSELFLALSYLVSIVVVVIVNMRSKKSGPGSLGLPYKRE
jgi:simple sugar transport system permease protein